MFDIFHKDHKLIGYLSFNFPFNSLQWTDKYCRSPLDTFYILLCFLESSSFVVALRTNKQICSRVSAPVLKRRYLHRLSTRSGGEDRLHFFEDFDSPSSVKTLHKKRLYSHSIFVLVFQPWPAIPVVKKYIYSNLTPASLNTVLTVDTVQSSRETEATIVTSNLIWCH